MAVLLVFTSQLSLSLSAIELARQLVSRFCGLKRPDEYFSSRQCLESRRSIATTNRQKSIHLSSSKLGRVGRIDEALQSMDKQNGSSKKSQKDLNNSNKRNSRIGVCTDPNCTLKIGDIVWARLTTRSVWWPGVVVDPRTCGYELNESVWVYWIGDQRISDVGERWVNGKDGRGGLSSSELEKQASREISPPTTSYACACACASAAAASASASVCVLVL
ncbi:hypothetical protein T4E_4690 [Trichinella pseudospiralis]|uniref:PWWP domain-containing protein n=1 Tax=Trichinella pseudospiralis TaxID=6337 RepID=A0A0V0XF19_TRIPS|nr:hypothetical protein T4E_4690 [Trichinella pseudospiralis]